jgi:predicted nucleic acid-binding protein
VIFVDTGAFLARYVQRDQFHAAAVNFWNELATAGVRCVTTNLVISETMTLLARRTSYKFAAERARQFYSSGALQIVRSDANDEASAIVLLENYAGQRVSFCDCVSFVIMRRLQLTDVFGFDSHFAAAGFNIRPNG